MKNSYFKYLKVTPFEESWGIYVTSVGYCKIKPDDEYPNERHPNSHHLTWGRGRILKDFYVVYISRGEGIFRSTLTEKEEVVAGNCFLLFPKIRHRYKPASNLGWEEYWIGLNGIQIQHMLNEGIFDFNKPIIDLGRNTDILNLFNKLIETVKSSLVGYPQQISGISQQILGLINTKAKYVGQGNSLDERLISKAKFLMQESFEQKLSIQKISEELPMGYSSFRKKFREFTGEAPSQYLLNLRLERAKYLLSNTHLNISEIGNHTGFDNVSHFSKMFKNKNSISPKKYRLGNIDNGLSLKIETRNHKND